MRTVQKIIIILLIPCFLIFSIASAEAKPSTRYTPEKAESEPVEVAAPPPEKGISIWWYILGAALIAGGVAAAAGGGNKDSSSSSGGGSSGGSIPVTW